jgi:V/A-type H+-transporting ATPase subunit I
MASKTQKIQKIRILFLRNEKDDILRELMLWGCIELTEKDNLFENPEFLSIYSPEVADISQHKARLAKLEQAFSIIKQHESKKNTKAVLRLDTTAVELLDFDEFENVFNLAESIISFDEKIRKLDSLKPAEHSLIDKMSPWKSLELPLNFEGTAESVCIIGTVSVYKDFSALKKTIESSVEEAQLFSLATAKKRTHVCIICLRSRLNDLKHILTTYNFNYVSFPDYQTTAADIINDAKGRLDEIEMEKAELADKIVAAADNYGKLLICYDHIMSKVAREEITAKMYSTDSFLMLVGWVPSDTGRALIEAVSKYLCAWELTDLTADELSYAPVSLHEGFFANIRGFFARLFKKEPKTDAKTFNPLKISTKYAVISYANSDNGDE